MYENFFEINKEILRNFDKENVIIDRYYEVEDTKDGYHTFTYKNYGKAIHVNSKYSINNEINMLLKDIDFNKDSLFVVYGIGLGYHIKELIKRSSKRSKIFVIESNMEILNTYLRNENLLDICNEKVFLFLGDEQQIISEINSHIFGFSIMPLINNIIPIIMPAYYSIYGKWIENINKRIIDLFRHALFTLGNDVEDTIIGLKNNFINMKELISSPSIDKFKDFYKDKPAIIVGAGPSLDKNIDELKKAQGKALIFATDAVISTLSKNDIIPDAVFSIERIMETYEAFYKNNDLDEKTVFIGPPVVVKEILEKLKNNKKLLCLKLGEKINEWINDSILEDNRLLKMGTSCTHIAFSISQYLGANPIIFIGQDLAFTKDGVTHSENVEIKNEVDLKTKDILYVKGIDGELLPTNYAYKNFLTYIEAEIAQDISGRLYIDATEGGAYKTGTIISTLKETLEKYCNDNIISIYDIIPEKNEFNIDKFNKGICELNKLREKFKQLSYKCNKHKINLCEIEKKISKISTRQLYKGLEKKNTIEQFIFNEDVVRTFLQGILMMSNIKECEISIVKNLDNGLLHIKIQKNLMEQLSIACNKICEEINVLLNDLIGLEG